MQDWGIAGFPTRNYLMDPGPVSPFVLGSAWNPSDKSATLSLSNANATVTNNSAASNAGVRGTLFQSAGKKYFEIVVANVVADVQYYAGFATSTHVLTNRPGIDDSLGFTSRWDGLVRAQSSAVGFSGTAWNTVGTVVGFALDIPNHLGYIAVNNTWQNSANPAAGTGGLDYSTTLAVAPNFTYITNVAPGGALTLVTSGFTYAPPSGFSAWG